MCIQDYQLGRASYSKEATVSVGTSLLELVANTPNRTCLIIGAPTSGTVYLTFDPNGTFSSGIQISSGNPPLVLDIQHHGDLVRRRFYAVGSVAGLQITIWQTFLDLP